MKDSLPFMSVPVVRFHPDPKQFYEQGVAPNGGRQAWHNPDQPVYKATTDTKGRQSFIQLAVVVHGVPESEVYYTPKHKQWLEDMRHHAHEQIDSDTSPTNPRKPRPHRPVMITAMAIVDWDKSVPIIVAGTIDGVPFTVEHGSSMPEFITTIIKTRGDLNPIQAVQHVNEGWVFITKAIDAAVHKEKLR